MSESGSIFYQFEALAKVLSKMAAGPTEFPEPSILRENVGSAVGVTQNFKGEVARLSLHLSVVVEAMRTELTETHETLRLVIADMVQTETLLADEAQRILALIDSALEPESVTRTAGSPAIHPSPSTVPVTPGGGYGTYNG